MKNIILFSLIAILALSCKKDKDVKYKVEVISDLSSKAFLDNYDAIGRSEIATNPFIQEFVLNEKNAVRVYANYQNNVQKPISITLSKEGKVLDSKTGTGKVEIEYIP